MKKIYLILILFLVLNVQHGFTQYVSFEKSLELSFNSGLNSILHDSAGYLYATGSAVVDVRASGILIKLDPGGNILFQKYFYFINETYFNDCLIAADGSLHICGYSRGCDWGPSQAGLIIKLTSNGDTIWTKQVNPESFSFYPDNMLRKITELQNSNLLACADSTLYFCNNVGDTLFTRGMQGRIHSIAEGLNGNIFCGNQSGLLVLDSSGQQINSVSFTSPVSFVRLLPDSSCLVNSDNTFYKLDSSYSIINQVDLSLINFSPDNILVESGKIRISNSQGSDFASFDFNLQLIDSFRTQSADVGVTSFSVFDSTIVVAGAEHGTKSYCYLKSYATSGNYVYYPIDLALTDVSFDTAFAYHPINLPPNVYVVYFVPRITVENTGSDTIHEFNINAETLLWGPCGSDKYYRLINNLNLSPGQSLSVALDTLAEFGLYLTNFPYTYQFCPWISCPDSIVDKNHSNDYLCDTFSVENPNAIDELSDAQMWNIFPNPTQSEIIIQASEEKNLNTSFQLYDLMGEKILSGQLIEKNNLVDLSEFSSGVYFISIVSKDKMVTKKIIKL